MPLQSLFVAYPYAAWGAVAAATTVILSVVAAVTVVFIRARIRANAEAAMEQEFLKAFAAEQERQAKAKEQAAQGTAPPANAAVPAPEPTSVPIEEPAPLQPAPSPPAPSQEQPQSTQPAQQQQQQPAPTKPPPQPPAPEKPSMLDGVLSTFTKDTFWAGLGLDIVMRAAIVKASTRVGRQGVARAALKASSKVLMVSARVLERIGARMGAQMLARLGAKAGQRMAIDVGTTIGTRMATKAAISASAGPGAPFVQATLLVFDVLSIGLDLGDAGGYNRMATREMYDKIKAEVDAEMKKAFEAEGGVWPSVVGPLDALDSAETTSRTTTEVQKILSADTDEPHPLVQPMLRKIAEDAKSGKFKPEDAEDDAKLAPYIALIDMDQVHAEAEQRVCSAAGGRMVDVGNGAGPQCSYPTEAACAGSFPWPMPEGSTQTYAEYRRDLANGAGACVVASYALRQTCEGIEVPYDTATGTCKIDAEYCMRKGANWAINPKTNQMDCVIDKGQDIAEIMFGTTVVRGLKQIFDPKQYEKCKEGEIDDVYTCRKRECPSDRVLEDEMCYKPCPAGFKGAATLCWKDCEPGWTNDGLTCRKVDCADNLPDFQGGLCYANCPAGYVGNGPVCWERCKEGEVNDGAFCRVPLETRGNGAGRVPDMKPCPEGTRDDRTSCWLEGYGRGGGTAPPLKPCPPGTRDDGTSCWLEGYDRGAGRIPDKSPCPAGLRDDGTSCWKDTYWRGWGRSALRCNADEERNGALCYPLCRAGYSKSTVNICAPNDGAGIKVNIWDRQSCRSDEQLQGGMCYPRCRDGYNGIATVCHVDRGNRIVRNVGQREGDCPAGQVKDAGLCYQPCRPGFNGAGPVCHVPGGNRIEVSVTDRYQCRPGEELHGALCYPVCGDGWTSVGGPTCQRGGTSRIKNSQGRGEGKVPDKTLIEGKKSEERGVGTVPKTTVRPKKRVIPFSSKSN
jgi:hypothetical protein